jgi:hypothetical protein
MQVDNPCFEVGVAIVHELCHRTILMLGGHGFEMKKKSRRMRKMKERMRLEAKGGVSEGLWRRRL